MRLINTSDATAEIARINSVDDLTQTLKVFEGIKRNNLSDGIDLDHNIQVLRDAIKAKTEAAVYAFYKYDGLGDAMDEFGDNEGISLMKRYGDKLQHILGFDRPGNIETAIRILQKQGITKIYTGYINREFCGISANIHSDNDDALDWDIQYSELKPEQIEALKEAGIEVIVLDKLI